MEELAGVREAIRRQHRMPFGAELIPGREVRFRLWAPAARRVELLLYGARGTRELELARLGDGWFGCATAAAAAGTRYRFRIDGAHEVADPAARRNPQGVHGPSEVVDPCAFTWDDGAWRTPPWPSAVIYELHVGTFTAAGTFSAARERLPHLAQLGVSAIELMPVAAFPGARGWGYDGVLPFAPQNSYGTPEELKALIAAAHRLGLAVLMDVVYNHFGPEGNYLHHYAPQFFATRGGTPWGAALNFDGPDSATVREFFIHNALYWLEEFHCDGLRFDAVHAIHDEGAPHLLSELARRARAGAGHARVLWLTLENYDNAARFLEAAGAGCDAQWNDDAHHCLHVLLSGESDGYYADYTPGTVALLGRSLAEGFAYQGETSRYLGAPRGTPSRHLPPSAFINFLQNHDQIGNRARGERLSALVRDPQALRAAAALLLLAPPPPLLFMGEEWGASEPFPWFCDFEPQLAANVYAHRSREFPGCPDPGAAATFAAARLDWRSLERPAHAALLELHRRLLAIRRLEIVPLLPRLRAGYCSTADSALAVAWPAGDGRVLHLAANLGARAAPRAARSGGRVLFATHPQSVTAPELPPWSVSWHLEEPHGAE
jgi:maltooligosyltrehalose trehalohydrolase